MEPLITTKLLIKSQWHSNIVVVPTGKWRITNMNERSWLELEVIIPITKVLPHKYWWQRKLLEEQHQLCSKVKWVSEHSLNVNVVTVYTNKCGDNNVK